MSEEFRIILQPEAVAGMESAYQWIESASPQRAHKWVAGLMAAINSLKVFPRRCPLAPENDVFDVEIRQHLYRNQAVAYRILFTIKEDAVNVLYIRHSAQQWITSEPANEETE